MDLQPLLEFFNRYQGLWTALAAVAATVATWVAISANRTTHQELMEAKAKERPWLAVSEADANNRPGGFMVDLRIRNYGDAVAQRHRMKVWRCKAGSAENIRTASSANDVVPTQEVRFPIECENHNPVEPTYFVVRLDYEDISGKNYHTWLVYNWPIPQAGPFTGRMTFADVEPAEQIKGMLQNEYMGLT
jgi:hypothetical protein